MAAVLALVEKGVSRADAIQATGGYHSRGHGRGRPGKTYGKTGRRYPEQSQRQALRGLRRAQGGPGLTEGPDPRAR
jgi:hypothetical protein